MNQNQESFNIFPPASLFEYTPKNVHAEMFKFEGIAPDERSILSPFSNDVSLLSNLSMNKFKDVQSRGSREAEHNRNDELPTRSTLHYMNFGVNHRNEPSKPFFNTVVNAINDHINRNKDRLLEIKVTRHIKEELKESDLVIEKEIDGEAPQMMYPVRNSSLSHPNFHFCPLKNEPIKIERVEELLQEKFVLESVSSEKTNSETLQTSKENDKEAKTQQKTLRRAGHQISEKLPKNLRSNCDSFHQR